MNIKSPSLNATNLYNNVSSLTKPKNQPLLNFHQILSKNYQQAKSQADNMSIDPTSNQSSGITNKIENFITSRFDQIKQTEQVGNKAINKDTNLTELLTSLNALEIGVQEIISIRDKIVAAYQKIMDTPI